MSSRWPVLVFGLWLCACGGARVEAGLANAPALGGTTAEESHDVVVKMPPRVSSHTVVSTWLLPGSSQMESQSLVVPWLEHFYVGWPCSSVVRRAEPVTVEPIACKTP
jgi:hypothetical protein